MNIKPHKHIYRPDFLAGRYTTETHITMTLTCSCGKQKKVRRKISTAKKRIKPVSDKKAAWNKLYREKCDKDEMIQYCAATGELGTKAELERHHPYGRANANILRYIYITKAFHAEIHGNMKWAKQKGWIQPAYDGKPDNGNVPIPWIEL